MIECSVVHVYTQAAKPQFVGCGAVVEGAFVATCRHVWRGAGGEEREKGEVRIVFPRCKGRRKKPFATTASVVDISAKSSLSSDDLVLLRPNKVPVGVMMLSVARDAHFEKGAGFAIAQLPSRNMEVMIKGSISSLIGIDGRRVFSGENATSFWLEFGSSGSPVFLTGGQQLAGLVSMAEVGLQAQTSALHEAFVVPGTAIWRFVERAIATPIAKRELVDVSRFEGLLKSLGQEGVSAQDLPERLEAAFADMRAHANQPAPGSNQGSDITDTIQVARRKVDSLDTEGALAVLKAKRAEVAEARKDASAREVTLLREQAAVERLSHDYAAAKATLAELIRIDPNESRDWINLGEIWRTTGSLANAAKAFNGAIDAARQSTSERELSKSYDWLGEVLRDQGDLAGALEAYRASLAIRKNLAKFDHGNADWLRAISVSYNKIGDVLSYQGTIADALNSYKASRAIRKKLVETDPSNAVWQRDLSISYDNIGNVLRYQGSLSRALDAYNASMAIAERLAKSDFGNAVWQRDLSVSHDKIGDVLLDQGDFKGAMDAFTASLAIAERLAKSDRENSELQSDLSLSHNNIGKVLRAQGSLGDALETYIASLAIAQRLALTDSGNAAWQRELSDVHEGIGDVLRDQGNFGSALNAHHTSLAIREGLVNSAPVNAECQRALSVSQEKIGDVHLDQGDLASALKSYNASLVIRRHLAKRDPDNAGWQRDLAANHERFGEYYVRMGEPSRARQSFKRALDTYDALIKRNPEEIQARVLSVVPLRGLARIDPNDARSHLEAAQAILKPLADAGHLDANRLRWVGEMEAELAKL